MKLQHENYGELTVFEVKEHINKTIIYVRHLNGEQSSMDWNVLLANKKIKII